MEINNYIRLGLSVISVVIAIIALWRVNASYKRLKDIQNYSYAPSGDSVDLARANIASTINEMKISMYDEIERLVSVKNSLERDLEKNPNNAMIVAKLEEIKRLIKIASKYYEMDVM